jgi:hypothetical protein
MKLRSWIAGFLLVGAVLAAAPDLSARHYSAREGRFLQRDPILFAGGDFNLYAYVGGNPVNRIDPLGESPLSWLFGCGYSGPAADAFDASFGRSAIGKWEEVSAGAKVVWNDGPLESRRLLVDAMAQRYALIMIHQGEGRMYIVAANDLVGTTNLMEGVYGVDIAQERHLDKTERWQRVLMGGGQTVLVVTGAQSSLSSLRAGYAGTGLERVSQCWAQLGRNIAARDIRFARNMFREAGISTRSANQVIRSFDLPTIRLRRNPDLVRFEFRYFDDFNAKLEGRFTTRDFISGQTDRIVYLSLPKNAATRIGRVYIPRDTMVLEGIVAPQTRFPGLTGGANQTFIMGDTSPILYEEMVGP